MKKKGLIIATIVMVLVLAVSLTTATYAWFTASAQATISTMTIQTVTGQGLQIATYDGTNLYSGDVVKVGSDSAGYKWATAGASSTVAGDPTGWGSDVTFTPNEGDTFLIQNMYGASGDGLTMFAQADPDHEISTTNCAAAVANYNYFVADIALFATSAGTIYINQLNITPNGTSDAKKNMAGSLRIALFVGAPTADAQSSITYSVSGTATASNAVGKFVIDPYNPCKYNGSAMVASGGDSQKFVTSTAYAKSSDTLKATWTNAKFIDGLGGVTSGTVNNITKSFATLTDAVNTSAGGNALYSIASVTVNQIVYMRLVIWFEGEDEACCQNLAGGGANIGLNFGLQPAA